MPENHHADPDSNASDPGIVQGDGVVVTAKKSKTRSWVMFVISIGLLIGAGFYVYSATDGLEEQWEAVRTAPWWMIGLIIAGPLGNHLSVSMCLHALLSRHGKLGKREMAVLIGSAWLLNSYLPMRPGLIGRVGYHKSVNNIRLRDSIESSIWSGVLSGVSNSALLGIAFLMTVINAGWSAWLPAVPVVLWFGISTMMPGKKSRLIMRALAYRQLDVIVWLGRYWLAFTVLDLDMSMADIAMVSAVSQFVTLIPLTGGGLGFREFSVGLVASAVGGQMDLAVLADLINRGAETLIVVPVGLVCTWIVARWWTRHRENGGSDVRSINDESAIDESSNDRSTKDKSTKDDAGTNPEDQDPGGDAQEQDPTVG